MTLRPAVVAALLLAIGTAAAHGRQGTDPLRVFVDCDFFCDMDFLRTEIPWIDYMRDRADADVHILVTSQATGGGGRLYTLEFIGLRDFAARRDTLRYTTTADDTEDTTRRALARTIGLGLVPFVAGSPLGRRLTVTLDEVAADDPETTATAADPWNFWTFRIGLNGSVNGESSQDAFRISSSISANRTTEQWKIELSMNGNYSEQSFTFPIEDRDTTIKSFRRNYSAGSLIVKSLGRHVSLGARASASTSTFGNTSLSFALTPALEVNVFPYSEATSRQLTALYAAGMRVFEYRDTTIFGEIEETRPLHSLTLGYGTRRTWGSINMSVEGSQYLHDRSKYSVTVFGGVSDIQLFRGLSFNVFGNYELVRDQITLARGDLTQEEVLLQQRELATNYRFRISGGISYRFGSIFNNVVNPRFDGGGGVIFF